MSKHHENIKYKKIVLLNIVIGFTFANFQSVCNENLHARSVFESNSSNSPDGCCITKRLVLKYRGKVWRNCNFTYFSDKKKKIADSNHHDCRLHSTFFLSCCAIILFSVHVLMLLMWVCGKYLSSAKYIRLTSHIIFYK